MNCVEIEFIPDVGLVFRKVEAKGKLKVHEVKTETLERMSLADLEYCLSTNSLLELEGLHSLFSDYLWGDNGTIAPIKSPYESR